VNQSFLGTEVLPEDLLGTEVLPEMAAAPVTEATLAAAQHESHIAEAL
jgi:hypothetical protein